MRLDGAISPNTRASAKARVRSNLQIYRETLAEKYLGLPTAAGRVTEGSFVHVKEQARSRVQGYCERLMSIAARMVLLKAVIQALPAYSMSCFKLNKGLCQKVTAVMSKFWWDESLDKRRMHWQSWDKMCIAKSQGGMGFRDLEIFNDAMLAKQAWRILQCPLSMCERVLKARYFSDCSIMSATCPA